MKRTLTKEILLKMVFRPDSHRKRLSGAKSEEVVMADLVKNI
jgi:hypothetical protein